MLLDLSLPSPAAVSFRTRICAGVLGRDDASDDEDAGGAAVSSDNVVLASFPTSLLDLVTTAVAVVWVFPLCCSGLALAASMTAEGMGNSCLELLFVIRRPLKDLPATLFDVVAVVSVPPVVVAFF